MRLKKICILFLIVMTISSCEFVQKNDIPELSLKMAYRVNGPPHLQPSGLAIWQDTLFTISDRHDSTIFFLDFQDSTVNFVPYINFKVPSVKSLGRIDFEGITVDSAGDFYLVSEALFRILKIERDTGISTWISPDLKSFGKNANLFQVRNANFEGITLLGHPNHFLLCAERQPRGLMEIKFDADSFMVEAFNMDSSIYKFQSGIPSDFAGLCYHDGKIYGLVRNAYVVCVLELIHGKYREANGWSYAKTERNPLYHYHNMKYGRAEGLCLDSKNVYIILDNNGNYRTKRPHDNHPLLFVFERPY